MTQLRITVIGSSSLGSNPLLPTARDAVRCEPALGIILDGTLETLLQEAGRVAGSAHPDQVTLELTIDRRVGPSLGEARAEDVVLEAPLARELTQTARAKIGAG